MRPLCQEAPVARAARGSTCRRRWRGRGGRRFCGCSVANNRGEIGTRARASNAPRRGGPSSWARCDPRHLHMTREGHQNVNPRRGLSGSCVTFALQTTNFASREAATRRQGPARHPPREPPVEREQLAARLGLQIARRATKAARIEGPHCTSDAGPGETAPPVSLSARRGAVGGAKRERRLATLAAASPGHCDVGRPRGGGGGGGEALATGGGVESAGY
ncbi:unnamed protein product [Lampetra planeri]